MKTKPRRKLVLIQPFNKKNLKGNQINRPLALAYIAALTPDNWEIEIIDESRTEIDFNINPDLVGITAYTSMATRAYEISTEFRKRGIPVVLGGIHISMVPHEARKFADAIVVGEAEPVWKKLINDFENGRLKKRYDGEPASLEKLVVPRRDLLPPNPQVEIMLASKGCPYICDFCVTPKYYNKTFRHRPVDEVLDELQAIKNYIVFFADDNLFGRNKYREHSMKLFRGIIDRKIKKAWGTYASLDFADDDELLSTARKSGCGVVYVGIEAVKRETLRAMKKGVNLKLGIDGMRRAIGKFHKHGIGVIGGIIIGNDQDNHDSFDEILEFARQANLDSVDFSILTPYPGTKLFERLQNDNRLNRNDFPNDWQHYNELTSIVNHPSFSDNDILNGLNYMARQKYSWGSIAGSFFRTFKNTGNFLAALACLDENINNRKVYKL